MAEQLRNKDEEIARLNRELVTALRQVNEAQNKAHMSSAWSNRPGNNH